ncbi:MAG: GDSL-type esterase/lipase family protein [Clostridiales bacterium]|nr:GDSL-type esterase/lipase family protein [Clostridiales bacterium]
MKTTGTETTGANTEVIVREVMQAMTKHEQAEKVNRYRILNQFAKRGEILFTGSSLMEQFPIQELLIDLGLDTVVYNRGIGGFTSDDMLMHMEEQVFGVEPSVIFINIGTNDLADGSHPFEAQMAKLLVNYEKILRQIKERIPKARVYLMAYYPVNETDKVPEWGAELFVNRNNRNLPVANQAVQKLAEKMGYEYIDVNEGLTDERGMLRAEYTIEGIHMYANGYRVVLNNMRKKIGLFEAVPKSV